ncbi:nitrate reductase cytochrome c-type subunit [Caminibacter sp.]
MKKLLLISAAVSLAVLTGCSTTPNKNSKVENKTVKITGIRKTNLNARSENLPVVKYNAPAPIPGKVKPYKTSYVTAPPMIPHSIAGMVPITVGHNMCLNCHDRNNAKALGVVPMPKDHYVDNFEGDKKIHKVAGSRYFCTTCHAPQANIPLAVENKFESLKAQAGIK